MERPPAPARRRARRVIELERCRGRKYVLRDDEQGDTTTTTTTAANIERKESKATVARRDRVINQGSTCINVSRSRCHLVFESFLLKSTVGPAARSCISIDDAYAFVLFLVYTCLDHELDAAFNNTIIAMRRTTLLIDHHLCWIPQKTVFTSTLPVYHCLFLMIGIFLCGA